MPHYQTKITGWPGAIGALALLAVLVYRLATLNQGIDDEKLLADLRLQLQSEYYPGQVDTLKTAFDSGTAEVLESATQTVRNTKLSIISVKGSFPVAFFTSRREVIVKVTFSIDEGSNIGRSQVRYYKYRHGAIGNAWQYQYESNVISYYLNFI